MPQKHVMRCGLTFKVLAVDNNSDVVRAARDFFAYRGRILRLALKTPASRMWRHTLQIR